MTGVGDSFTRSFAGMILEVGRSWFHFGAFAPRMAALARESPMLFVIHATDRKDGMPTRAKFYRAHRIHLDQAESHNVNVVTAGTLVADDGETPVGSVFVVEAASRAAVDAFTRSDPYHVNRVWETVQIHAYNKKRGSPMA